MTIPEILDSQITVVVIGTIIGGIVTLICTRLSNKRSLFTYQVTHNHIGISSEHEILGHIEVVWNDIPIERLYFSTVTLTNQSPNDFTDVTVRILGQNTELLTEKTNIDETSQKINFTKEYDKKLNLPENDETNDSGAGLWFSQREYIIPVVNRRQKMIFSYLHEPKLKKEPNISLEILHKGIKYKLTSTENQVLGVPRSKGVLISIFVGFIFICGLALYLDNVFLVAFFSFLVGLLVYILSAFAIKFLRKIRELVFD